MLTLVFACLLTLNGTELPTWAWVYAVAMAANDVLWSEMFAAFWRGLTGQ